MPGMIPPLPPAPLRQSGRRHFPPVPPSNQWEDDWNGQGKRTFDAEHINPTKPRKPQAALARDKISYATPHLDSPRSWLQKQAEERRYTIERNKTILSARAMTLRDVFMKRDPYRTGFVGPSHVPVAMHRAGIEMTEQQLRAAVKQFTDTRGFNWKEYCTKLYQEPTQRMIMWTAFDRGHDAAADGLTPRSPRMLKPLHLKSPRGSPRGKSGAATPRERCLAEALNNAFDELPKPKSTLAHRRQLQAKQQCIGKAAASVTKAQDVINARFSDMFTAFRKADTDGSGRLDRQEMAAVLAQAHLPAEIADDVMNQVDQDGDGISYDEFVAGLARDTVQKDEEEWAKAEGLADPTTMLATAVGTFGIVKTKRLVPEERGPKKCDQGVYGKTGDVMAAVNQALSTRFFDLRRAFQYIDVDGSGTVTCKEIERAFKMWNVPVDEEEIRELMKRFDTNGDGLCDAGEFKQVIRGELGDALAG